MKDRQTNRHIKNSYAMLTCCNENNLDYFIYSKLTAHKETLHTQVATDLNQYFTSNGSYDNTYYTSVSERYEK